MLRDPPQDSFPLSNYPMFSSVRDTDWIHIVVGFDAEDEEWAIPPGKVGSIEVMQAAETIRKAIRAKRADALCAQVAARVAEDPDYADVLVLEVQSRKFDPRTYFVEADGRQPLKLRRRARCTIERGSS